MAGSLAINFRKRKKDLLEEYGGELDEQGEETLAKLRRKLGDFIPAAGAIVAFILTEDIRLPMTIVDRWTPLMVGIAAISGLTAWFTRVKKDDNAPAAA